MTLRELIEKRNRLLAEARTAMTASAELTAEQRTNVDRMLTDANALKADIERMEACAETEERSLPANRPPREGFESAEDNRSQEERNAASNKAFRAYLRGERFEQRDLTIAADGGVMLPVAAVAPNVAQRSAGSLYDIVGHLRTTTGEDVRFPLWDDTGNGLVLDSAAIGNGTDPSVAGVTIKTDGLRTGDPLLLDNKLVNDVSFDLISYVNQALTDRYTRGLAQLMNAGNSSSFTGLTGNIPTPVTSESVGALSYDDFVGLIAALDPAYHPGAVFTFSSATNGLVRKIKDSQGRPLFLPYMDGATSGYAGQILGFPVKIDQYAPTVATGHVPVRFGDFSKGYQLREVLPGLVIKQSAQRWIELNRLGVIAFARAGGAPTLANSTTYSPIIGMGVQ